MVEMSTTACLTPEIEWLIPLGSEVLNRAQPMTTAYVPCAAAPSARAVLAEHNLAY